MGMGGIRELLDGKIWEWDLSFRWEWDGNGTGMKSLKWEGIGTKNVFPHTSSSKSNVSLVTIFCTATGGWVWAPLSMPVS